MNHTVEYWMAVAFFIIAPINITLFFIAAAKLESAEHYFRNNVDVMGHRDAYMAHGRAGRVARHSEIASILMAPKRNIRKGKTTQAELDAIPGMLKFWMTAPLYIGYPMLTWMIAAYFGLI